MIDGIKAMMGAHKSTKATEPTEPGEVSRVKKADEINSTPDKLVRSPKTDTFTSSRTKNQPVNKK